MRVLQAHSRHATRGGADAVLDSDAELLRAAGHEVVQHLAEPAGRVAATREAVDAVWNRRAVAALDRTLSEHRTDVLHVHTPFPLLSPAVFRVARRHGVPTVTTVHGFRYSCVAGTLQRDGTPCEACVGRRVKVAGVLHRCYHGSAPASLALTTSLAVHRGTLRHCVDRYLPLTEFAKHVLVRDGVPAERVTVRPNCVADPGPVLPASARSTAALFVGRLVEEKGVRTLLTAWRTVRDVPLHVLGDGPLRPLVEAEAAVNPLIVVRGWCDEATVRAEQARAAMTVVPSEWYEAGPPLVLLQALAAGTPVVCSDLENICATAAAAGAASTFRTGDPVALADAVRRLHEDPDLRAGRSRAARELYLRDHTARASLRSLEQVYRELTKEGT
ncbi:glycosyltransferase [Nocardioides marinquilinus]|uniref:Glycosyltransferase n=1 Tax=Nocardioides marinquilinus TaxID=1210400 RepID=A0ABP9P801_9ACTN